MTIGARRSIRYDRDNPASLSAACRELAVVIGPHSVGHLDFHSNTWNLPAIGVVFEAVPSLKYAEHVELDTWSRTVESTIGPDSKAFTSNFARLTSLQLCLYIEAFCQFSWTFLRQESASELGLIRFNSRSRYVGSEDMDRATEGLVGYCATIPRLLGREPLELDFSGNSFPREFGLRIIEVSN